METTLKLINHEQLGEYGPAKFSRNVSMTVASGKTRKQITELSKLGKKEQSDALAKKFTFTVNLDFTKMPLIKILELAANPQSLCVGLQNGLLRPLGDEVLQKIARGEPMSIGYGDDKVFKADKGVVYVTVKSWISRPKAKGNGKTDDEKAADALSKLDTDKQDIVLAKQMVARGKAETEEEALKLIKELMG